MSAKSPSLAALLSFIFPGLGQVYAGETRRGIAWAIPMLIIVAAGLYFAVGGMARISSLLTADAALALIVFDLVFFIYHVAAMIDAYNVARRGDGVVGQTRSSRARRSAPLILAGLISLAIVVHGLPAMVGLVPYYRFAAAEPGHASVIPVASFAHVTAGPQTPAPSVTSAVPTQTPSATSSSGVGPSQPAVTLEPTEPPDTPAPSRDPNASSKPKNCPAAPDLSGWAPGADGRLDIMLVGSDSRSDDGVSAASLRTDSVLLLSVDIASCKAALFSFPRNLTEIDDPTISRYPTWFHMPTETGIDYPNYFFGLWRDAAASPNQYPGSEGIGSECQQQFDCERGWRAVTYAVQQMSGVNVDGVVAVNLKGFVDLVRNLPAGGVWLDIPAPLFDDAYYNSEQHLYPVNFQKGCQFLDPEDTLAYARSRHQDSDYQRERRQQFVLQSIRKQLDPLSLLPHIGGLLDAAQANLFMTFSSDDFPYLAQVASRVDADRLYQYDFAPAHLVPLGSMQGMQAKVQNIFSEPEPEPNSQQQNNCPPK